MKTWARFRSWLYATLWRERMEREMESELHGHIEKRAADLISHGVPSDEAQRRALQEFGRLDRVKEQCREARGAGLLEFLLADLRYGLRVLRKNPGFASLAVMTLALGIGATTTVFSVVNAALLRALPYRDPGRLVFLWEPNPHIPGVPLEAWGPFNADFYDWQQQSRSFAQLALFTVDSTNFSVNGSATLVGASRVTGEFFAVLGVVPEIGRAIQPEDDQPGHGQVAVISHALWQSRFGSDRNAIGKDILLNARPYWIVGVMPAGFAFPHGTESIETVGRGTDIWVPWAMTAKERSSRDDSAGTAIGRLRPGATLSQAQAEIAAITARLNPLHPPELRDSTALLQSFDVVIGGASRRALLIFMAAVLLVLLIACGNIASLILARGTGRSLEISVRTALGASRSRLICQLLTESLCIACAGGALGVLAAAVSVRFLSRIHAANIPQLEEASVDLPVFLFTGFVAIGTALLFGLFPAISQSRANLGEALKGSSHRNVQGAASGLLGKLIIGEVALTIVLLVASGLLIRSFVRLQSVDKGFASSAIVTMGIHLDERYNRPELQNAFFRNLINRTGALPAVEAASAITYLPLGGGQSLSLLVVEGHAYDDRISFEDRLVAPRYFSAMGIPFLKGRDFNDADVTGHPLVAIVSRSFAQSYFSGESALGKRFHYYNDNNGKPTWLTIVGVVADVRQANLDKTPPMQVYTPLWQASAPAASIVLRTNLSVDQLAGSIRGVAKNLDPTVAIANVRTVSELVSDAMAGHRFQTALLTVFGGIALFLSLVGLYALMTYSVERRTAEIGIRMALGASRSNIMSLVLRQGSRLAFTGVALGLVCAWSGARLMVSLLFEVKPTDSLTLFGVAISFCGVALAACYAPARRAMRLDPMVALRRE